MGSCIEQFTYSLSWFCDFLCLNIHLWFHDSVLLPEEQHMRVHKEDSSVCESVGIEEKEQENEDSVTVSIQASGIYYFWICFILYSFAL